MAPTMTRARTLTPRLLACLAAGWLLVPALATAQTLDGGAEATPDTTASGPLGPNTLLSPPGGVLVRSLAHLQGELTAANAGQTVSVDLLEAGHGWTTIARPVTDSHGRFAVNWRARHAGRFLLRAGTSTQASASALNTAAVTVVEVYQPVIATWFGPGFYGQRTACGQILTTKLLGVAHRTLPCGTRIDITYAGRTISVPVVDRGPYTTGVTYDLTAATARALGIDGTAKIGALAIK